MWRLLCKVLGGAVHRSCAGGGAGGEGRGLTGGSFHPESGAAWWADGEGRRAGPWGGCGAQRPLLLCRNKSPKEKGASSTNSSRARVDRVLAPRPQGGRWFGDSGRPSDRQERHWSCSRGQATFSLLAPLAAQEGGWEPRHLWPDTVAAGSESGARYAACAGRWQPSGQAGPRPPACSREGVRGGERSC